MTIAMEAVATGDPRAVFSSLSDYRCEAAIRHYQKETNATKERAEEVFIECLKYLSIAAVSQGKNPAPSDALDVMWHAFIIQTREYAEFCDTHIGRFLHHGTTVGPRPDAYDNTLETYEASFGKPDPIWTTPFRPTAPDVATAGEEDCEPCQVSGWCSLPE